MLPWLISNIGNVSFAQLMFTLFAYAIMVFAVLPFHEFAHALAAHLLGDDTAKWNGRLTLNPLRHLDPFGTLMLVLVGVGYAKPVPVNPFNFRNRKRDMALTALAGPVSNVLLALVFLFLYGLLYRALYSVQFLLDMIWLTAYISLALAIFNIIPVSPLDGSKVLFALLPAILLAIVIVAMLLYPLTDKKIAEMKKQAGIE